MTDFDRAQLRRSVLYVPGDRPRAVSKAETLAADAIIFDLEDAVAPGAKADARETVRAHFAAFPASDRERVIRINALSTPWGTEDVLAARAAMPDAILIPKADDVADVLAVADALDETDAAETMRLWAMIETPRGVLNAPAITDLSRQSGARLDCLVVGTNDLAKEAGMAGVTARQHLHAWLMQIVLAAKAGGACVLDGVFNDHKDAAGCAAECRQGAEMGFDGKTLIHPAQIAPANAAFAPAAEDIERARRLVAAFASDDNAGKGVIAFEGSMAELLHLKQAERLLARAAAAAQRERSESP
ncbi:HpcH/HpaI aldolase/citrate lyase family protein [Oceaniradius stylonematis]|jgi:citrate lyase subunit beta/citryl-CoA lyase|uniref:HpcH/HpaI aldolase/citrate lyase family protein n=1 Tax=Oceaniradius stylonematis TaxID=2184161 RepID=UPI00273F2548|nr:CoA ester lyase [Oceaniradius stylonematis]